jgi:hypothetical protein
VTLVLIVISVIGVIGSSGVAHDPTGETVRTSEKVFGAMGPLSWLLCLFVGPFAWIRGRMTAQSRTAMTGRMAVAYVVLAVLVAVLTLPRKNQLGRSAGQRQSSQGSPSSDRCCGR